MKIRSNEVGDFLKKILFIGAGASYGARSSHDKHPPLGPRLLCFLRNNLRKLAEIFSRSELRSCANYLREAANTIDLTPVDEGNFERFLGLLNAKQRRAIHRALMLVFSDLSHSKLMCDLGFNTNADGYDRLIKKLNINHKDWIIISLNYDVLFEESLERAGIPFHYPNLPFEIQRAAPAESLSVYKPHGSINFFGKADDQIGCGGNLPDLGLPTEFYENKSGDTRPHLPLVYATPPRSHGVPARVQESLLYPIIANYTHGKESDFNEPTLNAIRKDALRDVSNADTIVIVGVNPRVSEEDDWFVFQLLGHRFSKIDYVGVKGDDSNMIKMLFPEARLHLNGLEPFTEMI